MRNPPALSVVVPVKDEAPNLLPLIGEIRAALAGRVEYEIVYVDDGSNDETAAILAEARIPELCWVRHRRSFGQSAAIRTGVSAAAASWIATLDGDGQNDPADIPRLLEVRDRSGGGKLLIVGRRRRRRDSRIKRAASRIANAVRGHLLGDRTPDTGCGLKLFRRSDFLDLPHFDHMHRFLPALFLSAGAEVISVDVSHRPRTRGQSKYGVFDRLWIGIVDLFGVMWLRSRILRVDIEDADDAS